MAYAYSRNVIPLGDQMGRKQSIVEIPAEAASDKPGILSLVAVADGGTRTAYYYWTDSNGVFRQHTSIPTNQDSDGTAVVASGAASLALDNLAAVAINTSLTSDTDNTDDLGTATKTWRSAYIGTSVVFKEAGGNITITTDNPSAARAYSIPDAGAAASFMLDTGAANVIAYTKGTSTIAMAANADLSIATGITLSVTAACTLDQNLAVAGTPSFSTVTGGTTTLSAATIVNSTGAISFGDENLTTTGTINAGGIANFAAGLKTVVAVTDVSDPPTQANMVTAFGAAATAGAGFIGFLNDANAGANNWICVSNGTSWFYATKLVVGA